MVKKIAMLYAEHHKEHYIVNPRGDLSVGQGSQRFEEFDDAVKYLKGNYGDRRSVLILDEFCQTLHRSDLEKKLRGTKITL
ncbi:MAG: hypothetical protein ABIH82_04390 [Candidatus Woesearchaeota archaeon]